MPPYRLWWLVLPLYAGYAVPAALLTLMFRPFGFLKVPLMRTAYFLDGIVAWFERTFDRLKSLFVRRGNRMESNVVCWMIAWFQFLAHQNEAILVRLDGDKADAAESARITAQLKASKQALDAAVLAAGASLPKTAGA